MDSKEVWFEGTWELSTPCYAVGKLGIDLRRYNTKAEIEKLMATLKGEIPADLSSASVQIPNTGRAKKIKSFVLVAVPLIAAIAPIVVAFPMLAHYLNRQLKCFYQ